MPEGESHRFDLSAIGNDRVAFPLPALPRKTGYRIHTSQKVILYQ